VEEGKRIVVKKIFPGSAAEEVGIKVGDIIVYVAGFDFRRENYDISPLAWWKLSAKTTTTKSKVQLVDKIILIRDGEEILIPAHELWLELRKEEEIPPGSY